jgi:hypothetical protein
MANNFDSIKGKSSSEKFNLIRLEPARQIESSLLLVSGTTYEADFSFISLNAIKVDGVSYTKVTSSPSSGEYSFNESTKKVTINLGAALTDQKVIAFYFLFYTTGKTRVTFETPTDDLSASRSWEPRIKSDPSFNFNIKDIQNGTFSLGASSISLHDQDSNFAQYLTDDDSFSNKKITIWLGLDSVENVKLVYRGFINRVTVGGDSVTISYFDEFSILNSTYFSNGTYLNSTYNSTRFPNIHPPKENAVIRKLFSEVTSYKVIDEGTAAGLHKISNERLLEAVCIDFNTTISTSNNREWGTILSQGDGGIQSDTVQSVDHSDVNFSLLGFTSGKKYRIGDTLQIAGSKYVRVLFVDNGANTIKTTKDATISVSDAIVRDGISSIVITQNNVNYYPLYGRDYTTAISAQTNDIIKITFSNNFEATLGMAALNPDTDLVGFRAWANTSIDITHANSVKLILEAAGLTVNSASITQANTDLTVNTNFYIPFREDTSFPSFLNVLERLLFSTLGYLSLNNDLEIEYSVFKAPSSANEITDRQILLNTMTTSIDYNDVRDSIVPSNVHDILELDFVNSGLENKKATYLHEIVKERSYNHILEDTSRMQAILDLISERKALYKFTVKTEPDTILGDQFKLTDTDLIGNVVERNITTVGVSKKATEVIISGYDLLGL